MNIEQMLVTLGEDPEAYRAWKEDPANAEAVARLNDELRAAAREKLGSYLASATVMTPRESRIEKLIRLAFEHEDDAASLLMAVTEAAEGREAADRFLGA